MLGKAEEADRDSGCTWCESQYSHRARKEVRDTGIYE